MTIRAPFKALHSTPYKQYSFEREIFFETLGACWALSSRNVSGLFAVQLQIDLSRINLLYGVPATQLPEELVYTFLTLFQARPKLNAQDCPRILEHNAFELIEEMNEADFLNFTTGFQDAVKQVLEPLGSWNLNCRQAFISLKYYGLNLIETGMQDSKHRRTYAELLVRYLLTTQNIFREENKTSPFYL